MRTIISLICGLFLLASCDPAGTEGPPELEVNFVTGINLSDENGVALGKKGNPNVKHEGLAIFPNPVVNDVFHVNAQDSIVAMWLVEGVAQKTAAVDMVALLENHGYAPEDIEEFPAQKSTPNASQFVFYTGEMMEKGYYRVFLQRADGSIVWDNIYYSPGATFTEVWTELSDFWD